MNHPSRASVEWDRILVATSYLYLVVPILIFFFGWLRLPLGLISAAVLLFGTYFALRDFESIKDSGFITRDFVVISFLVVVVWVVLSGVGGFGYQNEDLHFKNAILRDLMNHRWPVIYDYSSDPVMRGKFGTTGALVYYFAYWLPSAVAGKLFGWHVANLVLFGWTVAGVLLCVLLMARYIGRAKLTFLVAFVFWGGLDYIGMLLIRFNSLVAASSVGSVFSLKTFLGACLSLALSGQSLGNWPDLRNLWFSYPGFTYEFFWSYNQVVPAWLVTLLVLNMHRKKHLILSYMLLPLFAPIPAIGLLPFVVYKLLEQTPTFTWRKQSLRGLARQWMEDRALLASVLAAGVLAGIDLAFFGAHAGSSPAGFIWDAVTASSSFGWALLPMVPVTGSLFVSLLLYYLLKVVPFSIFAFNDGDELGLLIVALCWLALIPLYIYGASNDFGLRGCIPAMLVLFTVGFKNIYSKFEKAEGAARLHWTKIALVVVLAIGSIQSLHEILRSRDAIVAAGGFPPLADAVGSLDYAAAANSNGYVPTEASWLDFPAYKMRYIGNFVAADAENIWFFRLLARK